ncbi:MAG TPA: MATE family efflux transporter [Bacteroidetes bacterium]|nr:multidrug resistance protein NorM [bacterium BMS3Bbin04]HDO64974.1 MATE family efflux transporter [Bacteroidota bacterium]HEX04099.1 MATE family efflux transporter [Bacteroidota bacterium]
MEKLLKPENIQQEKYRTVWLIAWPVVVGMISQTLVGVVDTAMVGRMGATSLAATGLGGVVSWMVMGGVGALHIGVQAIVSRRYGEKNLLYAGRALDNAILMALVLGLAMTLFAQFGLRAAFPFFTTDAAVVELGKGYIFYRLFGLLPYLVIMAHRGFFDGIGRTEFSMRAMLTVNGVNIIFNYLFIFGNYGFPEMGVEGAGLASTIGTVVGLMAFLITGAMFKRRNEFQYYRRANISREVIGRIVKLALPSGLRTSLSMLGFTMFSTIVARIGTHEMAATNIIINVMSISFLPGVGFGTAAATLMGRKLGENNPSMAQTYGWTAARFGMLMMGLIGSIFIIFPAELLRVFTDDPTVIHLGIVPLRMMGLVQAVDAMGIVFSGAFEGVGLNKYVMITEISVNWGVFLPLAWVFAYPFGWGLNGAWLSLLVYIGVLAFLYTRKFVGGSWKEAEV